MKTQMKSLWDYLHSFLRWTIISIVTGLIVGAVGALFVKLLGTANTFRGSHPIIILGLPVAGCIIVFLYKICRYEDKGTNHVLSALHGESEVPLCMAPLIFVSTILTHLFGGSAGREGAALQIGGSIGTGIGKCMKLKEEDMKLIVMCGMTAAFSSIFGTPLAAIVFVLEVSTVGIMNYTAFVPCMFSSLAASILSTKLGAHAEAFTIANPIDFSLVPALKIALLGICCGTISMIFYHLLHTAGHTFQKYLKNPFIRVIVAGCSIILLTIVLKTTAYSGAGVNLIEEAFAGESPKLAFFWKIVFTLLTLGAGFKGGEIVPSFTIGATFGCLFGSLLGISPSLCAAVGMVSVFCGVTNCPLASILIGFGVFGFDSMKYVLIGVALSYMFSGSGGLYAKQKLKFAKFQMTK
jgi:H+/Cl- antiporter ClcA